MASLVSDSNGRWRIQWADAAGKRRQIRLGEIEKRNAERMKIRVETLINAAATGIDMDGETKKWVDGLSDQLHQRLAQVKLVAPRQQITLGKFFADFIISKAACSTNTLKNFGQAKNWFFDYYDESALLRSVTKNDANDFHTFLKKGLKSDNSVNTILKKVKQAFGDAVEREVLKTNPFRHIKTPIRSNPERMEFVRQEWTAPILKACPDLEWKIILLMARYAGVRVPSELQKFTWDDILWQQNRIRIHDAKRSRPGKPVIRIIPIFAELRPVLIEAYEKRDNESLYICPRSRRGSANLRTQMHKIIKKAGLSSTFALFK